jgi:hypothetical protein
MHDVGNSAVPREILHKPGALNPAERAAMERHAELGYRILAGTRMRLLELASTIAWTHHERVDGSGYPRGLDGSAIPVEGRIAAVADVFAALTHDRAHRPRRSRAEAHEHLRDGRGTAFDPDVLDAFLAADERLAAAPVRRARAPAGRRGHGARRALPARAAGAPARGGRALGPGHRGCAVPEPRDREDALPAHLREARGARPRRGRGDGDAPRAHRVTAEYSVRGIPLCLASVQSAERTGTVG